MNLENLGVQELNTLEVKNIEGGGYWAPTGNAVADIAVAAHNLGVWLFE